MKFCLFLRIFVHHDHRLVPLKTLNLGRLQIFIERLKQVGKLFSLRRFSRDLRKFFDSCRCKQVFDLGIQCVQLFDVFVQLIHKQAERFITGVFFHRIGDIFLHRMRTAIIPDDTKRLIRPKQAVGAGKCLNQPFVLQHLIQIQRVDPLGIKSRQHLIHHDQQVDLFFRGALHPLIRRFVRKTSRNVLFHFGKGGDAELLPIPGIVIFDDLLQSLFFGDPGAIVINVRVK